MIYIYTQNEECFIECKKVFIKQITLNQVLICSEDDTVLGEYSNKEKAKKIILEIKEAIRKKEFVYEMPKETFKDKFGLE